MRFVKMHGIGNDYVYVNAFEERIADAAALARSVSNRHTGVGSDGLILVAPPTVTDADVRMRMFNADGSESEMCGNGVRCVAKFAIDRGLATTNPIRVETGRGVLRIDWSAGADGRVELATVDMGAPILAAEEIPVRIPGVDPNARVVSHPISRSMLLGSAHEAHGAESWIDACGCELTMTCVSMGNPHAVIFCRQVAEVPLERVGPALERHEWFPRRINIHFVEVLRADEVIMRTWERGSGMTLACGTGASAVCVAGVLTGHAGPRVLAHLPGGDLRLEWIRKGEGDHASVRMTGPATEVFEGELFDAPARSVLPAHGVGR
ncbi:MAG: diaminopimelate epimerase [Phycisphaerae bacterium]|jgi:diaminopimelate epimerase|nr:diaminopimelate epimerase [Phycisphaerae bacterium]